MKWRSEDEEGESTRSGRLASTEECWEYTEVFGIGKLLYTVCQDFFKNSKTTLWDNKERYEVKLGREIAESIWEVEGEVYNKTSLGNTRLG